MMSKKYVIGILTRRKAIAVVIMAAVIVTALGSAVPSQEANDPTPKQKPRFEKSELTVTDNKSGLVWVLNANFADRQFSWSGAFNDLDLIINKQRYAGFSDWRVPTQYELLSLVELARSQGYDGKTPERSFIAGLTAIGFQNVKDDPYWSTTENHYYAGEAWVVDMTAGMAGHADKSLYFNLWPVRSAR